MNRVIITGATGFIGSWLVRELIDNAVKVTVIVRKKDRLKPELYENPLITIIEKPIELLTEDDFTYSGYDCFFHLAWGGVAPEGKNNLDVQLENITMSLHALEIAKKMDCKKFIASGTVAEYVFGDGVMDVNAKQTPNDMYGAAKVATHYFLDVRARQLQQPFNWIVIPSTFGEGRVDNNIITYTIRSLLNGEKPRYGYLRQMWDFLYVSEVVRAVRLIGEKGKTGVVYGIGSGVYRPLREYIETIRDIINPAAELGIGEIPTMSEKTFSSCVNIDELKRDTGFEPRVSFEEGISRTVSYIRNSER